MKGKRLSTKINNNLEITCNGSFLANVLNVKLLGLEIDEELSFSEHITTVCKKAAQRIGLLKKIMNYLPLKQRLLYYNALIRPVINYDSVLWTNCDKESLGRVLKLQKRAARVILKAPPLTPSVTLLNRLKWLPFYKDALISKCIIVYKRLHGDVPAYLNNLLKLNSNIHSRQTRYCNFTLNSLRYNRETEGGRTFTVTTCKAWNSLSLPVRQKDSVDSFKKALWNEFFKHQQNLDNFSI